MNKLIHLIESYFKNMESYSFSRLILQNTLVAIAIKVIVSFFFLAIWYLIVLINPSLKQVSLQFSNIEVEQPIIKYIREGGSIAYFAIAWTILITPLIETLMTQTLPIWLVSKFTTKTKYLLVISATVFAITHINPLIILWTFPVGILLAWSYLLISKSSAIKAIAVVATIHMFINLSTLIISSILGFI